MTRIWMNAGKVVVVSAAFSAMIAAAAAQDDTSLSQDSQSDQPQANMAETSDEDSTGFWDWIEDIPIEYADEERENPQRPRGGDGPGGTGGGGGGGNGRNGGHT